MKKEVDLIKNIGRIKRVKRAGWVREGVSEVESVADHSYRVAIMAMIFGERLGVDTDKLIKMILLHDLGEGIIGDQVVERGTKVDSKARDQKDQAELETVKEIFKDLPESKDYTDLHKEASAMETKEAKMLKQLERLEMAVQALEYEEEYGKDLSEFFENAAMHVSEPYLKEILKKVISLRPKQKK